MEAVKLSKARLKDIKGLAGTIQTLTALTTAHAKALEKVASTSEAAGNQFKKETGMTKDAYWIPLGSTLDQVRRRGRLRCFGMVWRLVIARNRPVFCMAWTEAIASSFPTRFESYSYHLPSRFCVGSLQISDEHRRLGEVLGKEIQEKVHQLLERHTLLDKQLNAEGGRLLKDLHVSKRLSRENRNRPYPHGVPCPLLRT